MALKLGIKLPKIASLDTQLQGHFGKVNIFPNDPKSQEQMGFGQNFSVMIEEGNHENFHAPYWMCSNYLCLGVRSNIFLHSSRKSVNGEDRCW